MDDVSAIKQLRELADGLPLGCRIEMQTTQHLVITDDEGNTEFVPLDLGEVEVNIFLNDVWYSFIVKDEEWSQRIVVPEILKYMDKILKEKEE